VLVMFKRATWATLNKGDTRQVQVKFTRKVLGVLLLVLLTKSERDMSAGSCRAVGPVLLLYRTTYVRTGGKHM
jgi:hypothetical protein